MLLDVVTPTAGVHGAVHCRADGNRRCSEVENAAVFFVGYFADRQLALVFKEKPARIVNLTAIRRIKGRAIENDGVPAFALHRFEHTSVEVVEKRVVIVETVGHWEPAISP